MRPFRVPQEQPQRAKHPTDNLVTTMTTATAARGALSARALTTLRAFFDERDHRPSADHWRALSEIVETLEAMADGRCAAKVYLSSCCPGLGKSQSVIHFARALASDPGRQKVGMIICVGRISEAETIATELRLPPGKLAVWTSDEAVNAIGATPHNAAQILVTTQQRVEQRCNQRAVVDTDTFVFSDEFYYRGQPRRVRVWDESFLPGTAVSLHKDDLAGLLTPLRYRFPDLTDSVEELFMQVRACEDGATIPIPDFERLHGVSVEDALEVVEGGREDQRVALTSLFILGGRVARVSRDGVKGNTALSWKDTLPADLAPLLILDASGRVRTTYQDMQDHRGTLVRLRSATKDYSPLVCHLWHKAGSKAGWERHGEDLINGIVRTILTKPDEQWLIVHHKPSRRVPDIIEALRLRLPADVMTRLSFVNWGSRNVVSESRLKVKAALEWAEPSLMSK